MLKSFFNKVSPSINTISEWKPAEQIVVRDKKSKHELESIGYTVPFRLNAKELSLLKDLYAQTHSFNLENGGMFYSVYSQDIEYRKRVHETINNILKETYERLFENYKVVISSFIVKVSGPDSEFSLHQDSTGLDEMVHSPLSVWIPLQDTSIENGCLAVVPKSFKLFSPYRGISFPEPFHKIKDEVKHYLQPIELKAGDVLLFDHRLVHYSPPNNTNEDRVVVMSGIFPNDAKMISCYKDVNDNNNEIELFEQEEDYLLTFKNFFHDCTCRPETGVLSKKVYWNVDEMNKESFIKLANENGIARISHPQLLKSFKSNIVPEPA